MLHAGQFHVDGVLARDSVDVGATQPFIILASGYFIGGGDTVRWYVAGPLPV
jgi:hypothetical protein